MWFNTDSSIAFSKMCNHINNLKNQVYTRLCAFSVLLKFSLCSHSSFDFDFTDFNVYFILGRLFFLA